MTDGINVEQPDWVLPMDFEIDDIPSDKFEKVVKAGFHIIHEPDEKGGKLKVIGRTIVKGNKKTDPLDVSE